MSSRYGDGSTAMIIFAILASIYSLTYSGSFRVDDEHILAARAQSLALWGQLTYPQVYGNDRVRELSVMRAEESVPHTVLEPGQAALGSLLYRAANVLDLGGAQTALTLNLYVTALTGVVVYLIVLHLGFARRTAVCSSLAYGLGTMAWPYAKTFFRDPLAAFMVAIAFLGWVMLVSGRSKGRGVAALLLGFGVLGGILTKHTATVTLPAFALSALLLWLKPPVRASLRGRSATFVILALLVVLIVVLALPDRSAFARFSTSYFNWAANRFAANMRPAALAGFLGPFISPAKSIFLFAPVVVLAPLGLVQRRSSNYRLLLPAILSVMLLAIAQALFHAEQWAGTLIWGLRYMLPAMPLMIAMGAPAIDRLLHSRASWGRLGLGVLLASSVLIQLAGSLVSWYLPYRVWLDRGLDPYSQGVEWDVRFSAIAVHLRELLNPRSWDVAWLRTLSDAAGIIALPLATVVFVAVCVIILGRIGTHKATDRRGPIAALIIGMAATVAPIFPSLYLFQADPAAGGNRPEFVAMNRLLSERVRQGDLVTIDAYGTPIWHFMMNHWTQEIPWYSLPFEIPGFREVSVAEGGMPSRAALDLFGRFETEFTRFWYVSTTDAPNSGLRREVSWLDSELELLTRSVFRGQSVVEVSLYVPDELVSTNATSVKGLDHRLDRVDGAWRSAEISILLANLPELGSP